MKPIECEFEAEALAAALQSRWPDRVDAPFREHVQQCVICSDVVAIAGAVDQDREEMRADAMVPDSGRVWWLAQMRARREAAEAAARPITAAQVVALACAVGLIGACFGATSTWFQGWFQAGLRWIGSSAAQRDAYHRMSTVQKELVKFVRPGVVARDVYREGVRLSAELGMTATVPDFGHSLGIRLHEYPILNKLEEQELVPDMVMCIEVSQKFEGLGNFHVEDIVHISANGTEVLTSMMDTSEMLVIG